jgi:hypothetical protein
MCGATYVAIVRSGVRDDVDDRNRCSEAARLLKARNETKRNETKRNESNRTQAASQTKPGRAHCGLERSLLRWLRGLRHASDRRASAARGIPFGLERHSLTAAGAAATAQWAPANSTRARPVVSRGARAARRCGSTMNGSKSSRSLCELICARFPLRSDKLHSSPSASFRACQSHAQRSAAALRTLGCAPAVRVRCAQSPYRDYQCSGPETGRSAQAPARGAVGTSGVAAVVASLDLPSTARVVSCMVSAV